MLLYYFLFIECSLIFQNDLSFALINVFIYILQFFIFMIIIFTLHSSPFVFEGCL